MVVSSVIGGKGNLIDFLRRDWRKYSLSFLCEMLSKEDWNIGVSDVQGYWNCFENKLINIVDQIVPLRTFFKTMLKIVNAHPTKRNSLIRENVYSKHKKIIQQVC
jgi:hypothetical protein